MELQIRNPESTGPGCEHVSTSGASDALKGSGDAITNHEVWSKVCINTKAFFRALGLNIIVSAFKFLRHPMGKGFEEPTKTAISQNRTTALLRALIHVIPVGVALWEITLNFYTYYVGSFIYNLVYYQFAAKAHEIMIQASLAAIVFSYVRHEMVLGKGLPFGALFSGLQINQISYLWSMEFWGSVGSKHLRIWRKMAMVSLITICFILAAAAGPSSAILLIPRLDYWQAGSTHIFINATPSEIWPDRLDASSVPPRCAFTQEYSFSKDCPSSEWPFLQTFLSFAQDSIPGDLRKASTELRNISLPYAYELTSKNSFRQYQASAYITIYDWAVKNSSDQIAWLSSSAISTAQQATIADAFQTTATVWDRAIRMGNSGGHHGSPFSDQQSAVHRITNDYFQPYSMAYCVRDAIEGSADYRPIAFPISPGFEYHISDGFSKYGANASIYGNPAIEYPSIVRAQLLELSGTGVHHMVKWVELPKDVFLGSTIGVIILLPQLPAQLSGEFTATDIVVCNVGAGWGPSSMNITTSRGGTGAVSSAMNLDPEYFANQRKQFAEKVGPEQMRVGAGLYQAKSLTTLYKIPIYPSKPVQASQEWAEYLNPFVPALNTTVIDVLMKNLLPNRSKKSRPEVLAQLILTGLITNGMARTAFTGQLQGTVTLTEGAENATELDGNLWLTGKEDFFKVDPDKSKDWVKLQVDSNIEGYAYNTRGPGPKVAISFLLAYCVLALTHLAYSGISGVSSTCWDSIAEVTALAVNSSPTVMLRNTCAGITEIRIFKIPVRILAVGDEEGEGEHLELMFGNVDEEVENKTIKPNRKYGTMPALEPASSKRHLKTQ